MFLALILSLKNDSVVVHHLNKNEKWAGILHWNTEWGSDEVFEPVSLPCLLCSVRSSPHPHLSSVCRFSRAQTLALQNSPEYWELERVVGDYSFFLQQKEWEESVLITEESESLLCPSADVLIASSEKWFHSCPSSEWEWKTGTCTLLSRNNQANPQGKPGHNVNLGSWRSDGCCACMGYKMW